jgi:hypothetical protein
VVSLGQVAGEEIIFLQIVLILVELKAVGENQILLI